MHLILPLACLFLCPRDPATYKYTWPATWCFLSVSQCAVALALELWSIYREQQAAGKGKQAGSSCGAAGKGKSKQQQAGVALVAECRPQGGSEVAAAGSSPAKQSKAARGKTA